MNLSNQNTKGAGIDTLTGIENLIGSTFNDTLTGDSGAGQDTLIGGNGKDTFKFNLTSDSAIGVYDTIKDFIPGQDKIDLSAIDANIGRDGNNAFVKLISNTTVTQTTFLAPATLYYNSSKGMLYGNVDGIYSPADFAIQLTGGLSLTMSDIIA